MKKSLILGLIVYIFSFSLVLAAPNPSIWITLNNCNTQENAINNLSYQDHIFINGAGFGALNDYRPWKIEGTNNSCNQGQIIANGTLLFDSEGSACVDAYIINENNCGDYKVYIGPRFTNISINEFTPPVVPEFSTFLISLTLMASLITYLTLIRK